MQALRLWWESVQQKYTYRIPTALGTGIVLITSLAIFAIGANNPQSLTTIQTGAGQGIGYGIGEASPREASSPGATEATTQVASVEAGGVSRPRAAGTQAAGDTAEVSACPEGMDKGGCTGIAPKEIRLGIHAALTQCGTALPDTSDPNEAEADTWVEYINKVEGGIHGRQLKLFTEDDGYCPAIAGQAATKLIDEYRVFSAQGFLGVDQNRTVAEKAQNRGVPYIAGGGPRDWEARWSVFHQGQSSYDVMYPAVLKFIIGASGLNRPDARIGVIYIDTPDVRDPTVRSFSAVPQANVVSKYPFTDPDGIKQDWLDAIAQFRRDTVNLVYCNCHPLNTVAFVAQADAQGFKPQYSFVSQGHDLDLVLRLFPGDSTFAVNAKGISNYCHPSHPCMKPYEAKIKQVKPNAVVSQVSLVGIHAIEMWAEALRRAGYDVNRAKFIEQLATYEGWTTGLTGPVDLSPNRSVGAVGFAKYESPGAGSRAWRMVDVGGKPYNGNW